MPYTLPTATTFKAKFPTFAPVADATIDLAIAEAGSSVDTTWIERDYQPAILYLAAHIMTIDGVLAAAVDIDDASSVINSGLVTEMKVGDVAVKLASGSSGSGSGSGGSAFGYGSTAYGQRYLDLLRRNHPAVALV
jgi:hypothetical protein